MKALVLSLAAAALLFAGCREGVAEANAAAEGTADKAAANWIAPAAPTVGYPALTGRVVDEAGLLTPEQEAGLSRRGEALERHIGPQFVIVTVNSLQGRPIADYARDLGNHWGIGHAERNDGVILLVAPNERQVRIAVGEGANGALTDAEARTIIERDLLPAFREGDWWRGLDAGARSIALQLGTGGLPPPSQVPAQ